MYFFIVLVVLLMALLFLIFNGINGKEGFETNFTQILPIQIEGDNKTIAVPNTIKGMIESDITFGGGINVNGDIQIKKNNCIEFARGERKEGNAGKISYNSYNVNALCIVGASDNGSGTYPRRVQLWDDVTVTANLTVNQKVNCQTLNITSDERVKHLKEPLRQEDMLQILRQLKPLTYRYKGTDKDTIGFIAQDVQKILPSAISSKRSFISNICDEATVKDDLLTFDTFLTSDLQTSKKLKIVDGEEHVVTIVEIINEHTIRINTDKVLDKVFGKENRVTVFGQEVNDFLSIDKNQLLTVAVSTIQALDAQAQSLNKQLQEEKEKTTELFRIVKRLEQKVDKR